MMKKIRVIIILSFIVLLSACGSSATVNNFAPRKDDTYFSNDGYIKIEYKTDSDGKLIELNIDRLLTIEEMIHLSPNIDYDYELEGFTGAIFTTPRFSCTKYNGIKIPFNIEIGNTRYKYDDTRCQYRVVDNYNEFKSGFSANFTYDLDETIQESTNTKISIIVYNPLELVSFIEVIELQNSVEGLGVYSIIVNRAKNGFDTELVNYYRDMGIYEQLYLTHQENEAAMSEVKGESTDINLADITNLTESNPLVIDFEDIYEKEILAIEELQDEIGVNFTDEETEEEPSEDESPEVGN
ncbi:hypothetical protein OAO42_01320 [Candidatus Izimaplasma bacterium]|nr:hypothetical protein [Candidatus Izimaplasma bacterium]